MGKDLTTVSTNEADALALIGNAVTALKVNAENSRQSIEREASGKADQAGLEYQKQINAINNNLNLSANEREDAYAAAESQLATDTAAIKTWVAQQTANMETNLASLKGNLDDFVADMTDADGLLNTGLGEKTAATNNVLANLNKPLITETGVNPTTPSVYKKPVSKADLDKQLAEGTITQEQYNSQVQSIGGGTTTPAMATATPGATEDPLLKTLLSGASFA
jgi:hypothetical protein